MRELGRGLGCRAHDRGHDVRPRASSSASWPTSRASRPRSSSSRASRPTRASSRPSPARTDLIVSDALNHASIIDGMRLSRARRAGLPAQGRGRPAGHPGPGRGARGDPDTGEPYRLILVVTDGVFCMDGDICPLPGIVAAAEEHGAAVYVDDAHGSGVLGDHGRGTRRPLRPARARGHPGGHALQGGRRAGRLRGRLGGAARPADPAGPTRSSSRPRTRRPSRRPASRPSAVMREEDGLFERLWANTRRFKAELAPPRLRHGRVGDAHHADHGRRRRRPPSASPTGSSRPASSRPRSSTRRCALDGARLRTIVTAAHTDEHLDRALEAFARVGRELGLIAG